MRQGTWLGVALMALTLACGGGDTGPSPTPPPPPPPPPTPVASVVVTPNAASLMVGQTIPLAAEARAANGSVLTGRAVTWVTSEAQFATVSGSGVVTAVAPGSAIITATSEGRSGTASIVVSPVPAAAVSISPPVATMHPTQSRQFTATVTDAQGGVLVGRTVAWTVSNEAIASVSASGVLTAVALGPVTITATVEGKVATAAVSIIPVPVASVTLAPTSTVLLPGGTQQLTATTKDSAGNILTGRAGAWTSSNQSVASVSQSGLVTAVALGTASIQVVVEGVQATSPVTVQAFLVTGISVDTLVAGQSVTIQGGGFSTNPGSTTVVIGGTSAAVGSVTSTSIVVQVPAYQCHPTLVTNVRVTSAGEVAPDLVAPMRSNGTTVSVGVGQYGVVTANPSGCLHFPASSTGGSYLVGVTDLATSGSTLPWGITLETRGGAVPNGPSPVMMESVDRPRAQGGTPSPTPQAASQEPRTPRERWQQDELSWRAAEEQYLSTLGPSRRGLATAPSMGASPQAVVPNLGDIVPYRFPINNSPCLQYITLSTRVRSIGQRYILVEDVTNPILLADADLARWGALLDQPILPLVQAWFGTPTDFDNNNRIVIIVSRAVNQYRSGVIGFVRRFDITDSRLTCPSSNDGEFFYMWAQDPAGVAGSTPVSQQTWIANLLGTWAHEIVHIIQYSELLRAYGVNFITPKAWIAEGGATLAEEVAGWAVEGLGPQQELSGTIALASGVEGTDWFSYQWSDLRNYFGYKDSGTQFSHAPQNCLWTVSPPGSFSTCVSRGLYYGVGANFQRWIMDHVGSLAGGPMGFAKALYLANNATLGNGMAPVASLTGLPLEQTLIPWQISLWADGRAALNNAAVQQPSWDLPSIFGAFPASGRLSPAEVNWGATTSKDTFVMEGSSTYTLFQGQSRPSTSFSVVRTAGGALPSMVKIWFLRVE